MSESNPVPEPVPTPSAHQAAKELREAMKEDHEGSSLRDRAAQLKASTTAKLDEFRDFAGDKAAAVRTAADEKFSSVKAAAEEKGELVRVSADEQWREARVKMGQSRVEVEQRIREKPFKAVLIAAAVGYVLGRSLRS